MVRFCQPLFSAALIAYVESHESVLSEKNSLCTPVPSPERPADWLLMWAATLANTARWRANPGLRAWLSQSRLNNMTAVMRGMKPDDSAKLALLQEMGAKARIAATKLPALISAIAIA